MLQTLQTLCSTFYEKGLNLYQCVAIYNTRRTFLFPFMVAEVYFTFPSYLDMKNCFQMIPT